MQIATSGLDLGRVSNNHYGGNSENSCLPLAINHNDNSDYSIFMIKLLMS